MMFKHGFVHCDPHAANLLVRPSPSGRRSIFGKPFISLVILLCFLMELDRIYTFCLSKEFQIKFDIAESCLSFCFNEKSVIQLSNVEIS